MTEQPVAVIVTDAIQDKNAIKEAKTLNIPVFAICDSNVDPTVADYPIPANDDAIKSVKLILDYFVAAIKDGKAKVAKN
jgi:small subunit ribosomal protein S2